MKMFCKQTSSFVFVSVCMCVCYERAKKRLDCEKECKCETEVILPRGNSFYIIWFAFAEKKMKLLKYD